MLILALMCCLTLGSLCPAVTSKVVRHTSSSALLKGKTENVVIGSRGTIQLGRAAEAMVVKSVDFAGVWSINSIVTTDDTIYFGTSPNGGIYKYAAGELTRMYPRDEDQEQVEAAEQLSEIEQLVREIVEAGEYLTNEHIFAMAIDSSGALLVGISGRECKLCRFKGDKMEVLFEPDAAKYIFAIALDADGSIYLGTGPEGNIYKLDPGGRNARVIYDCQDKNILSLAIGQDGSIYAGSDGRGLVYRIDPAAEKATVLYDSEQPEITALLIADSQKLNADTLYAAATSAKIVQTQTQFAASSSGGYPGGRTEAKAEEEKSSAESKGDLKLEVANTKKPTTAKPPSAPPPVSKGDKPSKASHIYEIAKDGFVTDIFGQAVVFFCLVEQDHRLLAGTGNSAKLFSIDPILEQQAVIYEDQQAAQITAIAAASADAYLGTANPAKLVKLSDLIDAGQPAKWGKLQLEADIPEGCQILASSRSGNVKDVNDPTFSPWSEPVVVAGPIQLRCPLGRFCQYKLILQSRDGSDSPLIREVAVASTVPNRAPRVASVVVSRVTAASKQGYFKISYVTRDVNGDKLIYKIDFRKLARTNWIELKDELEATSFEWNARTVEDGRYEIRVTASDERSNTVTTRLLGSRVSEPIVVDNSGPVVTDIDATAELDDEDRYEVFKITVSDELSAIGNLVYDTTEEDFTLRVDKEKKLPPGDHVLTVRVSDAVGNTTYRTLDVRID
jgi:hypothetical protein